MFEYKVNPSTMFVMYTLSCNSKCKMCSFWKNVEESYIDNELIYNVVEELYSNKLRAVFFTGGECLIRAKSLFELSDRLLKNFPDLKLKINTNGLLLKKFAPEIAKYFDTVVISMDSTEPEIYRKIRGVNGIDIIKEGINKVREIKPDIRISLRCIILEENIDSLEKLIDYAIDVNIDKLSFKAEDRETEYAFGRGKAVTAQVYSKEFIKELEIKVDKLHEEYRDQFDSGKPLYEKGEDLKRVISLYKKDNQNLNICNCATHCCVIYPNATVSPCFFMKAVGDCSKGINAVFSGKEYQDMVGKIINQKNGKCQTCVCPVTFT